MRRGMTATLVVTVLVAVSGLLLLVWSSSSGSPLVRAPQGTWGPPPITLPTPVEQAAVTGDPSQSGDVAYERHYETFVDYLYLLLIVIVFATLVIVLRRMLDQERRERDRLSSPQPDELAALLEASGEEVRYRALTQGDARNAVVACWVALEDAVYRSGLEQDPALTASELTGRVLTRWEVDPRAIRALSEAYREARFSRHSVTEQQRRAAVHALERIHQDLRSKVETEGSPPPATGKTAPGRS